MYSSVVFSKLKELHNHHHSEILEHSHRPPEYSTQLSPQLLATRSLLSVSVDLLS